MTRVTALAACVCLLQVAVVYGQEARGVVYDFTATWCGPCQQMAPVVEKLQREGLPIVKVDFDQQRELAAKYQIQSVPTFLLVVDGKEAARLSGRISEGELRQLVARVPQTRTPEAPSVRANPQSGRIAIDLGQSAPMTRPAPIQTAQVEQRTAEAEPKKGLLDRLPFVGKEKPVERPVVRGNDSALTSAEAAAPAAGESSIDPMEASVRIRVITNGRIDLGSGTVISSKAGISWILTCAHIFKGFTDDSRIEVDVFEGGRPTQVLARLKKFDNASDLGLISISTDNVLRSSRIAPVENNPKVAEPVASIGCSGGDEPTRQQSRVTDIDVYDGPHNLLCTGVPVRGRSGGGLFNKHGEVVGVCSAYDKEAQRGFYSGLLAIHKLLTDCGMSNLYASPAAASNQIAAAAPASFPAATSAATPAAFPESVSASPLIPDAIPARASAAAADVPATIPAALAQAANPVDVQAGHAEVVVIIRDVQQPQNPNRIVILHQASPKFMSYLSGELDEGAIDSGKLLGANTAPAEMPTIQRAVRQVPATPVARVTAASASKSLLQPTTIQQQSVPQKYTRSK